MGFIKTVLGSFNLEVANHHLAAAGTLAISLAALAVPLALQAATRDGRIHVLAIPDMIAFLCLNLKGFHADT